MPATRLVTGATPLVLDVTLTPLATSVVSISSSFESPGDLWLGNGATVQQSALHVTDGSSSSATVTLIV